MEHTAMILVGILLLVMGYLIGVRQKIKLVHSYHYKRVAEEDKPSFCKGVGIGNGVVGVGLVLYPVINSAAGETAALWIAGVLAAAGLVIAFATIIKYNKGLF